MHDACYVLQFVSTITVEQWWLQVLFMLCVQDAGGTRALGALYGSFGRLVQQIVGFCFGIVTVLATGTCVSQCSLL